MFFTSNPLCKQVAATLGRGRLGGCCAPASLYTGLYTGEHVHRRACTPACTVQRRACTPVRLYTGEPVHRP
eukprot:5624450-Heterocapsa_arctica.AAC.1